MNPVNLERATFEQALAWNERERARERREQIARERRAAAAVSAPFIRALARRHAGECTPYNCDTPNAH